MRAMILAAGRGARMKPLTDHLPKPLLCVAGQPLIVYHLKNLAKANIREIVINLGHLGYKIEQALGNGNQWGVSIRYSYEDPALETAGGIFKALDWLGREPFVAVSGDVLTDFPFEQLPKEPRGFAHLVLVDNPPHHSRGDYALQNEGLVSEAGSPLFNFAGIGVYRRELFQDIPSDIYPLGLLFKKALLEQKITGEYYKGLWHNIGTPQQLKTVDALMQKVQA
jgi:MurNAc alpha-1-phosphate uridylyltransferase